MIDNLTVTAKIGETAKVITVVLKDTDESGSLVPKDLTGYTQLRMQVEKENGTVIIGNAACLMDPDQATNPGRITCTLDIITSTYSNLAEGKYRLEFNGLNPSGRKRYWPMDADQKRTYGVFIVQKGLDS